MSNTKLGSRSAKADIIDTINTNVGTINTNTDSIETNIGSGTDAHSVATVMGKLNLINEHVHTSTKSYPFMKDPISLAAGAGAWGGDGAIVSITNNVTACDAADAVNIGGGVTQIPVTGHHVKVGYYVTIPTSTAYTGMYPVVAVGANTVNITATYIAETFEATDYLTDVIPADFDIHRIGISALSANGDYEVVLFSGAAASEVEICRTSAVRNAVQSQEASQAVNTPLMAAKTRISARVLSGNANADTCSIKINYHTY